MNQIPIKFQEKKDIASYNILELLGLQKSSGEEKTALIDELNRLIWIRFLNDYVLNKLSRRQRKHFENLAQITPDYFLLMDYLKKTIPDFNLILVVYSSMVKENFIITYFEKIQNELNGSLKLHNDQKIQVILDCKLEKIGLACHFTKLGQWEALKRLMQ